MVRKHSFMEVDSEDLRIFKGIASFKGKKMKDYFRELVDDQAQQFHMEMRSDTPVYRRRK